MWIFVDWGFATVWNMDGLGIPEDAWRLWSRFLVDAFGFLVWCRSCHGIQPQSFWFYTCYLLQSYSQLSHAICYRVMLCHAKTPSRFTMGQYLLQSYASRVLKRSFWGWNHISTDRSLIRMLLFPWARSEPLLLVSSCRIFHGRIFLALLFSIVQSSGVLPSFWVTRVPVLFLLRRMSFKSWGRAVHRAMRKWKWRNLQADGRVRSHHLWGDTHGDVLELIRQESQDFIVLKLLFTESHLWFTSMINRCHSLDCGTSLLKKILRRQVPIATLYLWSERISLILFSR